MLRPTATIELIYTDETGSTSAVQVNVPVSSTITILDANATALASLIAPITDAVLTKVRYKFKAVLDGDISDAGSNPIAVAGVIFMADVDETHIGLINIPAIKDILIQSSGNGAGVLLDTGNTLLTDLVEALAEINVSTPMGDALDHLLTAYRQSRV